MSANPPVAVIDIGSNTIRLLVARPSTGSLETLLDESDFVRLGVKVDETGQLQPDREEAGLRSIAQLSRHAASMGADPILGIATSAVRDARNGREFTQRVRNETGVTVDIVSGEREAELTYLGATYDRAQTEAVVVCDLGGGSAELIYAESGVVKWAKSQPLGSGRLTERFVRHDPPGPAARAAIEDFVRSTLSNMPAASPQQVIFTGGTASNVCRLAGREGVSLELDAREIESTVELLYTHSSDEIVSMYGIQESRAAVLPAGSTALLAIAQYYRLPRITITRHGIRDGVLVERLQREGRWLSSQRSEA